MPSYDVTHYDPPAPIASVSLRAVTGQTVTDVLLLIDTGADVTLLPRNAVVRLGIDSGNHSDQSMKYELIGFDGSRSTTDAVDLDMMFLNKAFRGRYLLIDSETGILGRDVLASVCVLLDGPGKAWSEQAEPKS